jgi:hypothetical protein
MSLAGEALAELLPDSQRYNPDPTQNTCYDLAQPLNRILRFGHNLCLRTAFLAVPSERLRWRCLRNCSTRNLSALGAPESAGMEGLRAALKPLGLLVFEESCPMAAPTRTLPALDKPKWDPARNLRWDFEKRDVSHPDTER